MTRHRWTRLFALSLTVVAVALPSLATAATSEQLLGPAAAPAKTSSVNALLGPTAAPAVTSSVNALVGPAGAPAPTSSVSAPTVTSSNSDFIWADAALGAGVAFAAVTIGVGGALMLRRVRAERREVRLTS